MRLSRRRKLAVAGLLLVSVLTVFFTSHYIQLSLMEHISLKTFIVRMIVASQNLNASSPMYGSFFNSSWFTMEAVDVLNVLGALNLIDAEAMVQFLTGPDQAGPVDRPLQYAAKYNVDSAFIVTHTASVIDRLGELPSTLVDKIRDTIIANQNSTSREDLFWSYDRTFLFETARLMNETRYVNLTFQKQEILDDIVDEIGRDDSDVSHVLHYLRALQELHQIETDYSYIRFQVPEGTRNMIRFYTLSLWDDSRYGFYESLARSSPKYYEGSLAATYSATRSYIEVSGTMYSEELALMNKLGGYEFGNLFAFLSKCQNRYGIFFDKPSEVSDKVNSLQIWPTFNAIVLLSYMGRMDFLNQTARWPPNPTLIESLNDRFSN